MIYTVTIGLLIEKPFYLLRPQSLLFQIVSEFILKGGAFDSLFCPQVRIFVHNDCPGRRVLVPFKSCPGVCPGGGGG